MADDAPPQTPHLDEHDINAVMGMLIRVMRIDDANRADKARMDELTKALAERAALRPKYIAGIGAFGFDMTVPDVWKRVRAGIGDEAYVKARSIATLGGRPEISQSLKGESIKSTLVQPVVVCDEKQRSASGQDIPNIRDAILGYLRSLPEGEGVEVAAVKNYLAGALGVEGHEKTPGMTLYRLSKDKLVRREGRRWFAQKNLTSDTSNQEKTGTSQ